MRMNANETSIYIIESNRLAAQYIRGLFNNGSLASVKVIDSSSLGQRQPIDSNPCLLILDRPTISSALLSWGLKLRTCFPNSNLIVIAEPKFGDQVRRMFQRWVLAVIDYADLQQLPAVVLRSWKSLSEREETRSFMPSASESCLLQTERFSRREKEILELMCLRLSNKEIANLLDVKAGTVKFHVSNIFSKMGLRRRRELFSQVEALVCNPSPAHLTPHLPQVQMMEEAA